MMWTAKEETKEWKMLKDKQTWTRNRALIPNDVNPVKNNETQQRKGTQDRSMDRFEWKTSTRCLW